jgi:hypothetical protein
MVSRYRSTTGIRLPKQLRFKLVLKRTDQVLIRRSAIILESFRGALDGCGTALFTLFPQCTIQRSRLRLPSAGDISERVSRDPLSRTSSCLRVY